MHLITILKQTERGTELREIFLVAQPAFSCSKSSMETLKQCVKSVQS